VALQIGLGKYVFADPAALVSWCRVFTIPEPAKGVRRHICEPLLNDLFSSTPTVRFSTAAERRATIARFRGGWAVALDLASFFDQVPLGDRVRRFFGIATAGGTCTMRVLPMGFRPSAAIGQAVTWAICDIAPGDFALLSYIDNILVLARTKEEATRIADLLVARAASIGAVFNDVSAGVTASQEFDFLGCRYDLRQDSFCQTPKTLTKVAAVRSFLDGQVTTSAECTRREAAAIVGLFLFASSSCGTFARLPDFYGALRFYREHVAGGDKLLSWDQTIVVPPMALASLRAWAAALSANEVGTTTAEPAKHVTDLLFVDSSEQKWAAVHVKEGHISVFAEPWTAQDAARWALSNSVCSEPLGIQRALCRCITPSSVPPSGCVAVYTDHEPAVWAVASPCAKAYTYAHLQQFLLRFPVSVSLRHIPGDMMPADVFTRSDDATLDRSCLASALQYHATEHGATRAIPDDGENGNRPEWALTARNPLRVLQCCSGRSLARR
jgi:hypothetical protein